MNGKAQGRPMRGQVIQNRKRRIAPDLLLSLSVPLAENPVLREPEAAFIYEGRAAFILPFAHGQEALRAWEAPEEELLAWAERVREAHLRERDQATSC